MSNPNARGGSFIVVVVHITNTSSETVELFKPESTCACMVLAHPGSWKLSGVGNDCACVLWAPRHSC